MATEIDTPASGDLELVALAPSDMPAAQQALTAWCDHKIRTLGEELKEIEDHRLIATANGWKMASLTSRINLTARRVTYYEKLKAAVEAGYLIVPNMPVDVLAVRVKREKPKFASSEYDHSFKFNAAPQLLPAGEGRYVDNRVVTRDDSYQVSDGKGGTTMKPLHIADAYDEPDFPWAAVKPAVLDATARAMALKIFDQIGVVTNTSGRDPIMVGQLLDPRGQRRCATFFLAWWLNTADL
jgi:hypothetical protein